MFTYIYHMYLYSADIIIQKNAAMMNNEQ